MKKIWLIALLFNGLCGFLQAVDFEPPLFGLKADFGFAEGVFYTKEASLTYGLALYAKHFFPAINLTVKVGKLSASGSLSKLNSPALAASASAFSSSVSTASGLSVNLPSSSAVSKPLSIFCEYEYSWKKIPLQKIKVNAFVIPQANLNNNSEGIFENADISFWAKIKSSRQTSITAAYTAGIFQLDENIKSSWFFNNDSEKYYHAQNCFCQNLQLTFNSPFYSCSSIFSAYQSPSGRLDFCGRLENQIKLNRTSINFAGFLNRADLITGSQKYVRPQLQAKAGIHHTFIKCMTLKGNTIPLFINTGFNSYIQNNLSDAENEGKLHDEINLKNTFGLRCTSDSFTLSATASFSALWQQNISDRNAFSITSWSIQTKQIFLFKDFKPTLTQTLSFSPSPDKEKQTSSQKFALSWIFSKNPYLSGNLGITLSQKNRISEKTTFTFGLSAAYTWKQIKLTAKISGKIQ